MPTTSERIQVFLNPKIFCGSGKAANAGGVATSGLKTSRNSLRLSLTREEVDLRLHGIMKAIRDQCVKYGTEGDEVNCANIDGFVKVADAMMEQGLV